MRTRRVIIYSVSVLLLIIIVGTLGFYYTEPTVEEDPWEALWLTLVTVTTTGYGDIVPTTDGSRVVAAFVMIVGVGVTIYTLTMIFQLTITANLRSELGLPARRTRMKNHYIVIGYGNVGRQVGLELKCKGETYLVVEKDQAKVENLIDKGITVIQGDGEEEDTLKRANIAEAKGLVCTMRDSQNLVTIIAARTLNPNLFIVSEVEEDKNIAKLLRVGADKTINCHEMGARVMVDAARRATLDPVCQVEVSSIKDKVELVHDSTTYTFCSRECAEAFKKHPDRFLRDLCPSSEPNHVH